MATARSPVVLFSRSQDAALLKHLATLTDLSFPEQTVRTSMHSRSLGSRVELVKHGFARDFGSTRILTCTLAATFEQSSAGFFTLLEWLASRAENFEFGELLTLLVLLGCPVCAQ